MTSVGPGAALPARPRAWLVNGIEHALRLDLDARGRFVAGALLRKRDDRVLVPLRIRPGDPAPRATCRLRDSDASALAQLWRYRPGTRRAIPRDPTTLDLLRSQRTANDLQRLGIGADVLAACRLPSCPEPLRLQGAGRDRFGRVLWLHPATARAWSRLRSAASTDGIVLEAVSGFRSAAYQTALIARKLERGQSLERILEVSALPGHSEHHLGHALDLHSGDGPILEPQFELTPAFTWLCEHAGRFGFGLSYPRNNPTGITYEPWHWRHWPCV